MKAIVYEKYGLPEVLQLKEVEKPSPKEDEVLIKIYAAAVTAGDAIVVKGEPFVTRFVTGLQKPKNRIPGKEMAGRVEAVGGNVTQFQPGDEVFGDLSVASWGAFAEYVAVPENAIALKPANLTFEQAAAVPESAVVALQGLRDKGKIQPGQKVLINGASGGVGTYAVQIAKSFGAEVTAVDSTDKLDMLRSIGADLVIDYTQEDFTKSGKTYDLILDVVGKSLFSGCIRSLKQNGRYLIADPGLSQMVRGRWTSMTGSKKVIFGAARPKREDLDFLRGLIEAGKLKSIIDRRYPLQQIAEAHRYVEKGSKKGNVVITVADSAADMKP